MIAGLSRLALASLVLAGSLAMVRAGTTPVTRDIVVFAAASLKNALDAINAAHEKETGTKAVISYAASSALAKQIESGAPAQVFISADIDWMTYLDERKLIKPGSATRLLGNRLVLIAPRAAAKTIEIKQGFSLADLVGDGRLAVANVDAVPAGKYAKAALKNLGAWDGVKDKLAQAENVRAALLLVSRGEAPAGIVYATDAAADSGVSVVGTFPEDSHPPIVYMAGMVAGSTNPGAERFFSYLATDKAKALFKAQGFTIPD